MNKLIQAMLLGIVGLVLINATGPTITKIIHAATPLILILGIFILLFKWVSWFTR